MLVGTDRKISAIASSAGFNDSATLHRAFKRFLKVTPRAVRRDPVLATTALKRMREESPQSSLQLTA
jgi:AraC-like DNA-binding protein